MKPARPRILCVDDEPHILDGLKAVLRREFTLTTATSGAEGLKSLADKGAPAVVMSDMRMPQMNGAEFLRAVKAQAPDTVRILLTGESELKNAVAAVNEGGIFRFLRKPCPPDLLKEALWSGVRQYDLLNSERVLLEKTLHGSIRALVDILALANPALFGRASRIKKHVAELAKRLEVGRMWEVEVAAMLSQTGTITLPPEVLAKVDAGDALSRQEQDMVDRVPRIAEQLVRSIPRLEAVAAILGPDQSVPGQPTQDSATPPPAKSPSGAAPATTERVRIGRKLLRIAQDYEALEGRGCDTKLALERMFGRHGVYDPDYLNAFAQLRGMDGPKRSVQEVAVGDIAPGMVIAQDVLTNTGSVFVARGYEVTERFVQRLRNMQAGTVNEPILVSADA